MYDEMSSCGVELQLETKPSDLLYFLIKSMFPSRDDHCTFIINEAHKSRYFVHPDVDKMYSDLRSVYWWHRMKKDIVIYVSECLTCKKVKADHQKHFGLLKQPSIPVWKWDNIAMDFITKHPKTHDQKNRIW